MVTRLWRHFDLCLLLATVGLVVFGLTMIYSATYERTSAPIDPLVWRQGFYAAAGLVLMIGLAGLDYRILENVAWALYVLGVGSLMIVLVLGRILHGAQRWLEVGPVQFQPSEVGKIVTVLALGRLYANHPEDSRSVRFLLTSLLLCLLPAALILAQPDVGTATVYVAIWIVMAFVAGARMRYFALVGVVAVAAAPAAWLAMQTYQRDRVLIFLDPQRDPLGTGYNAIQALISVGSGELTGRGFLAGTQSQLHFLRVQYADFIFSVLGEEFGFVGAVLLLTLFAIVLLRGLRAATVARDQFGRLVAAGIVATLAYQVVVNVGMNVGLLPVTGVPLPLISFGGSSLVTFLASIGILESIGMRHKKFEL